MPKKCLTNGMNMLNQYIHTNGIYADMVKYLGFM